MTSALDTLAPPAAPLEQDAPAPAVEEVDLADVLVEEVSIDGMCGVY